MAKQTIQIADKPTLDEVKALLENEGYGLEALQALMGNAGGETTYPNVRTGQLSATELKVNGKGKILVYASADSTSSISSNTKIDGVKISDGIMLYYYNNVSFTFEKSISISTSNVVKPHYILQLAD